MLVAHVEQEGVWLVEGGMHRLAAALADLASSQGVTLPLRRGGARDPHRRAAGPTASSLPTASASRPTPSSSTPTSAALAAGLLGAPSTRAVAADAADRSARCRP